MIEKAMDGKTYCINDDIIHIKSYDCVNKNSPIKDIVSFFITDVGKHTYGENFWVKSCWEGSFEFIFVTSGSLALKYDGKEFIVNAGESFLIDCGIYYEMKSSSKELEFYFFHITGDNIRKIYNYCYDNEFTPVRTIDFSNYIEKIFSLKQNFSIQNDFRISNLAGEILSELVFATRKLDPLGADAKIIEKSLTYIRNNFYKKISLDTLSAMSNMSKTHFIRLFKKHTGTTPYEYILIMRIENAKQMLIKTDETVECIALEVGFSSANNFIEKFKKSTKKSPMQFRKKSD